MSRIQIDISKVRSCNEELRRNNLKISNIARDIFLSMGSINSTIQARRNIGSRLKNACDECNEIEQKLTKLQKFISNSMDRYEKAERKVENESEELISLWNLRMETLVELKSMVGILGTSSSYIENAKMLYDGEKVGDDEDEDTEEILEETDELLKEVNEEDDDNDWRNKPAKEDIFDKFADWLTEKVTGEKASPKTQGEEVIEAQLTSMSLDEQNILADIANDYQTAFRGLGSADRINEALENFEEEPVFSSRNNTKVGGNLVSTGARNMSVEEYFKQEEAAETMYNSIRNLTDDVSNIAKNTGMSEQQIQRIKDHVFSDEHILLDGVGQFNPDYDIAQAWNRLSDGNYNQSDIDLLNHELFESKFEGIFKTDYQTAHNATISSGRTWDPDK